MAGAGLETRLYGNRRLQFRVPGTFLWIDAGQVYPSDLGLDKSNLIGLTFPVGKRVAELIAQEELFGPVALSQAIKELIEDRPELFPPRSDN